MLRHIVLLTFNTEVTAAQKDAWRAAVRDLCETSSEVLSFTLGDNIGSGPNHHDSALVADFNDVAAFRRYIGSSAHMEYVENHARHVVGNIAAIQHEH